MVALGANDDDDDGDDDNGDSFMAFFCLWLNKRLTKSGMVEVGSRRGSNEEASL